MDSLFNKVLFYNILCAISQKTKTFFKLEISIMFSIIISSIKTYENDVFSSGRAKKAKDNMYTFEFKLMPYEALGDGN